MATEVRSKPRSELVAEFERQTGRHDGARVAQLLDDGLIQLRDLFYTRVCADVETIFGSDSMLVPVSRFKSELRVRIETDLYLSAEAAFTARDQGYIANDLDWFSQWVARLRLGESAGHADEQKRLKHYLTKTFDERRRTFSVIIEKSLPEARKAALVLYHLLPLASAVVASLAFGDHRAAEGYRERQKLELPAIADCPNCHGRLKDIGEKCPQCGNPLWKHEWLTTD